MKKLTWKTVICLIKAHGGICHGTFGGEHVVKIAGGTYYTCSPEDAVDTAKTMYDKAMNLPQNKGITEFTNIIQENRRFSEAVDEFMLLRASFGKPVTREKAVKLLSNFLEEFEDKPDKPIGPDDNFKPL
jgi:hypothetical protein